MKKRERERGRERERERNYLREENLLYNIKFRDVAGVSFILQCIDVLVIQWKLLNIIASKNFLLVSFMKAINRNIPILLVNRIQNKYLIL